MVSLYALSLHPSLEEYSSVLRLFTDDSQYILGCYVPQRELLGNNCHEVLDQSSSQ